MGIVSEIRSILKEIPLSDILREKLSIAERAIEQLEKENIELKKENKTYRKKLMELEKWAETDRQHELREVAPGIRVFVRKGLDDTAIKKTDWFCPKCWHEKIQMPLQREYDSGSSASYICPSCKFPFQWDEGGGFAHADIAPSIGDY